MSDLFDEPDHATPLEPGERLALIPEHITYRWELNAAEEANIIRAQDWALGRRHDLLTEKFIKELHRRMFDDVWKWAGKFRNTERNIGVPHYEIAASLLDLLRDVKAWIENHSYPPDEIAVRFHHRLVKIHPFPNGNGRHARLMADLLVESLGGGRFSWGGASLQDAGEMRRRYIDALKKADDHDISRLLTFARL